MSEEAPADPPLETFIRRVEGLGAAPLERLRAAIDAAERLSEVADHLVGHFVDEARLSGASWADIGGCLGVTRQAVQKRFVPRGEIAGRPGSPGKQCTDCLFGWYTAKELV